MFQPNRMEMNMRNYKIRLYRAAAVLSLLLPAGLPAFGATATDIKRPGPGETVEVLVQYATQPTSAQHQRVTDRHGRVLGAFEHVPVAHYEVSPEALAELEADPGVVSISPNRPVSAVLDHAMANADVNPLFSFYVSINRAKAYGIGIAIIDSGIYSAHPDLAYFATSTSRIVYSETFIGGDTNDEYGHGTHVAGIAAGIDNVALGLGDDSRWFDGPAGDASLINLKVLDGNGNGTDANVIAAIDRAIALKYTYNIRVINLSLGRPVAASYKTDPLCQAVEAAWKAGIVVVVAAGNDGRDNSKGTEGYGTITAPGNDPYVITVGASNDKAGLNRANDVMATYSSKGPTAIDHIVKPDLVAPGNRVVSYQSKGSLLPALYPANQLPIDSFVAGGSAAYSPYFLTLSGTSMATPVVSGVAALLIDRNSGITPDQVKAKLMKTAWRGFPATMSTTVTNSNGSTTTYTAANDIFTIGAGQIDAWAAYNDSDLPYGTAASPSTVLGPNGAVQLQLNPTYAASVIWGSSSPFATSVIWGSNVGGTSVIWGSSAIWGSMTTSGSSVLWGSSAIWGSSNTSGSATDSAEADISIAIDGEN
jgi:serine protease AprX